MFKAHIIYKKSSVIDQTNLYPIIDNLGLGSKVGHVAPGRKPESPPLPNKLRSAGADLGFARLTLRIKFGRKQNQPHHLL